MGTDKPKIQGYILPKLYDRFEEWKRDRGITKDYQALNQLFSEFFGVSTDPINAPSPDQLEETITSIVQERTEYILNNVNDIVGELQLKVRSLSEQLEALTQAVTAMQSPGGLLNRLPSDLLKRLPVQDAIADVNQAVSDFQVSQSESPASVLSATLERGTNKLPSNLDGELSANTPKSHIESAGELPNNLPSESLKQTRLTGSQETSEPAKSELTSRLSSDSQVADSDSQPEVDSGLPVNHDELLTTVTEETALEPSKRGLPSELPNALLLDTLDSQPRESMLGGVSTSLNELPSEPLTQAQLADRLGVDASTLTRQKGKNGFPDWSRSKDPDSVAWRYNSKSKRFHAVGGRSPDL